MTLLTLIAAAACLFTAALVVRDWFRDETGKPEPRKRPPPVEPVDLHAERMRVVGKLERHQTWSEPECWQRIAGPPERERLPL